MKTQAMDRLADALAGALAHAEPAAPELARYAETALGGADDAALAALLDAPDDPEGEVLRDLVLFPGAGVKRALEPLLAELAPDEADEPATAQALAAREPQVCAVLPGGREVLLRPDGAECAALVRRLRIGHGVPAPLAQALEDALPSEAALAARLRLRHCRCPWTRRNARLLETAARSVHPARDDLPDLLVFLGDVLAALPEGADVLDALRTRYEDARRHLEAHARFTERLARHNYETLTLRGERMPHADPAALRREMTLADAATLALFGARASAPPVQTENLGSLGPQDVSRLLGLPEDGGEG